MQAAQNHRYSITHGYARSAKDGPRYPATNQPRLFLVREAAPEYALDEVPTPDFDMTSSPGAEPVYGSDSEAAPGPQPAAEADSDPDSTPDSEADEPTSLSEADDLEELGDRCVTAYMQADALQYRAMVLLAEFHHRQGWKNTHCSSTDEWLAWRLGIHRHTAQERLRTALALEDLPLISQAMEEGQISYSKVRTLRRAATPENEAALLEHARAGSAANLDKLISGWALLERKSEVEAEQLRHKRRRFSAFVDTDGMVVVRGRLDPEVGAVLMRAVEAATDALYRDERLRRKEGGEGRSREGVPSGAITSRDLERVSRAVAEAELGEPTPTQRRADAVGLLAERALAAGFGGAGARGVKEADAAGPVDPLPADSLPAGSKVGDDASCTCGSPSLPAGSKVGDDASCHCGGSSLPAGSGTLVSEPSALLPAGSKALESAPAPISGTRAERYMVMLHVDEATLSEHGQPGLSELHDGTRVSAETSRRLACDCSVVKIHRGPDGEVTGAGRRMRTVNLQLRRALEARDRGCRFPGCGARFTEAHHVVHWKDGGETTLDNCLLLCRRHHRAVHEGRVTVCLDRNAQAVFFTPKGKALAGAPPRRLPPAMRPGGDGFEAPVVEAWAVAPKYNYDREIPWEEEARVWEVLDPA